MSTFLVLTDEEIKAVALSAAKKDASANGLMLLWHTFARDIEAALLEKNIAAKLRDNVVPLRQRQQAAVNGPLVKMLEDAKQAAMRGELAALIATGFTSDGSRYSMWADNWPNYYEQLGCLVALTVEYEDRVKKRGGTS